MFSRVALLLFAILVAVPARGDSTEKVDEKLLQDASVGIDGPGLLAFFRRHTPVAEDEQRLRQLVQQLGSARFAVRESASRKLGTAGRAALPLLRDALRSPDKEVVRRAEACLAEIERGPGPDLPAAAARLLARRAPAGSAAALLAYLPFASDPFVEEEVMGALAALASMPGKVDPVLTTALKDALPLRRAAAAHALGRHSDKTHREAVGKLLADESPVVRFRAAQGLIAGKERTAIPVLIALIGDDPSEPTRQAEEILWRLAGERSPTRPTDNGPAARKGYRDAWSAWWRDHGRDVDLARFAEQPPYLGLTIIAHANRVWECQRDGKVRWTIGELQMPIEALMLPGNRVLITENSARRVTERDLQGKILWEYKAPDAGLSARRLTNGNTFVVTNSTVEEVMRDGRTVYSHKLAALGIGGSRFNSACRLRNGRLLVLTDDGTMAQVEATTGKVLVKHQAPDASTYSVEPLPGGGWLAAAYGSGKVIEYDANAKSIWEYSVPSAFHATRLPDGNTLIASYSGHKVIEVTRAGKIVWERGTGELVWRAHRR